MTEYVKDENIEEVRVVQLVTPAPAPAPAPEPEPEVWKPIKGYGDAYQVSDLGRVRALDRTQLIINNGYKYKRHLKSCIKATSLDSSGLLRVKLSHRRKRTKLLVGRLVAKTFIDSDNDGLVAYRDGDRTNCRADNLYFVNPYGNPEWGTAMARKK